jgi:hypothetical protein
MWFSVSASIKFEEAEFKRDDIEKKLSKKQLAKAQDMARRCQLSNYKKCD